VHDACSPSDSSRPRRVTLGVTSLIGLALIGAVLSACSSSTPSASTSSTATTAASTTTTAAGAASGGSSDSAQIQSLSSEVRGGQHATYKATYTSHNVTGTSESLTIEQMPPKSVFSSGTTSVINDGTHTYFCSPSSGSQQCVSEAGSGTSPLASITAIFDPSTLLNEFQAAEAAAAAHTAGYSLAFSSGTYAGLSAKCVNFTHASTTVKYCVTDTGILAYASSGGSTFELTGFSSSPSASDFALPAGATVITVPTLGSTP
jgi:plastocyanin